MRLIDSLNLCRKAIPAAAAALLLTTSAFADSGNSQQTPILVAVEGMTCQPAGLAAGSFSAAGWNLPTTVTQNNNGGGGGGNKVASGDLTVTKGLDACTTILLGYAFSGVHLKSLTLTQRLNQDDRSSSQIVVKLQDVTVSASTPAGSAYQNNQESVSFHYSKFSITYTGTGTCSGTGC